MAEALVVDARDEVARLDVVGLPLFCRLLRLAARAGHTRAVVLGDPAALGAALARRPPPPAMSVTVEDRAPAPGEEVLDGRTLTHPGLTPFMTLASAADVPEAERRLTAALRKPIERDGVVAYHLARPLTRPITRLLLPTNATANQVTMGAMACGVAAGLLAATGGYLACAVAGLLLWMGQAIDCIDGDIARLRVEGSKLGEWLDSMADDVSTLAMTLGLGVGLGNVGAAWPALGALGFVVGGLTVGKIYLDLSRMGATIDSAQYPWFFGKPSDAKPTAGPLAALMYLFRRDAYVTMVTVLLLAGARVPAFLILFVGLMVFGVLLAVHLVVAKKPA